MLERLRKKKFFRSRISMTLGIAFLAIVLVSVGREWYQNYTIQKEIRALEEEAARLEARRLELLGLTESFENGAFLEEQARIELGLQRPGETVVVVEEPQGAAGERTLRAPGNPTLWWEYFVRHGRRDTL